MNLQLDIPFTQEDPLDKLTEALYRCQYGLPSTEVQNMLRYIRQEKAIKQDLIGKNIELQFRVADANKRLLESTIEAQAGYFEYLTGGTEAENKAAEQRLQTICHCSPKIVAQTIIELQRQRIMTKDLGTLTIFVKQFNAHFHANLKYDSFHAAYLT